MASAGLLIYSGVMPLIKMFLTILAGFVLARKGLFPMAASKGASQVTMNIALPALIFSSVVPAFTPSNVSAIGPLALIAVTYILLGFVFGLVIREVCYVPRNFWQGIVIATGLSNWGNLPTSVVLSVTKQSPFNPTTDPDLGVSFVAVFIVVYHLFFWVGGAAHSLSWDYLPGVPQGADAERRVSWKQKPIRRFISETLLGHNKPPSLLEQIAEEKPKLGDDPKLAIATIVPEEAGGSTHEIVDEELGTRASSPVPRDQADPSQTLAPSLIDLYLSPGLVRFLRAVSVVVTPITLTIAIALPIALVQPLKALFVDTTAVGGPSWKGPDGRPPLAFVLDTAQFIGNLAVPVALILLGASFARLRIPRPISRLPIPAMLSVCVAKMVVLPVIGVFMVQAMVKGSLIDKDSKAERFVAMLLSGTPSAVNQLIISGLYSPTGDLDTLSACLLAQYIFMFFSSAALISVSLLLL